MLIMILALAVILQILVLVVVIHMHANGLHGMRLIAPVDRFAGKSPLFGI